MSNKYFSNIDLNNLKANDITESVKEFTKELKMNINQVRKFYNEILALKNRYETEQPSSEKLQLDLALFLSKVEYGKNKARKEEKKGFEFYLKHIESLVNQIKEYKDFKNFLIIMEAILAYYPKQN